MRSRRSRSPSAGPHDQPGPSSPLNFDYSDGEFAVEEEVEPAGDKFKLILRSSATTQDITLTVRPTATCGAIVKAFLKSSGLQNKYPSEPRKKGTGPALQIDGDRMNPLSVIGDSGLEDGDCVDVVGL
jgi:Ubiquitin-2 like Rad60 SUMO-like